MRGHSGGINIRPGRGTRSHHFPDPIRLVGNILPAQSQPISTLSGSVSRAPVSLFGDLCLGHHEGQLSQFFHWEEPGQP